MTVNAKQNGGCIDVFFFFFFFFATKRNLESKALDIYLNR